MTQAEHAARQTLARAGVRFHTFPQQDLETWKTAAPDFFARFVLDMAKTGKGEAAKKMVALWQQMRQDITCPEQE